MKARAILCFAAILSAITFVCHVIWFNSAFDLSAVIADRVTEAIEDATGWEIARPDVEIWTLGIKRSGDGSSYFADFSVRVKYRNTKLSSSPTNVPCTVEGVPTAEGNVRIQHSIHEIVRSIKAIRT
jgi:hypothetical protein